MRKMTTLGVALLAASPGLGHHSDAGIDMSTVTTLQGTVTEFSWRNPHVYFTMQTAGADGETTQWQVQMGATNTSIRKGWSPDVLSPGDEVTALLYPARNGRPYGILDSLEIHGGGSLSGPLYRPIAGARAASIAGTWMADPSDLASYPGGFDGFFRAMLQLTPQGAAAQAAYDELSADNPESTCIGRPTPGMIISSHLFPMQIELGEANGTVLIRSEIWDEERTVYMDGRTHPEGGERFASGHSIGWWEGETLVVDTANFPAHRSPYQTGVPSGEHKHVVERYRLSDDGTRLIVQFVLEDPEYLAAPLTYTRELIYSPQLQMLPFECDAQSTSRFLPG